MNERGQLFSNCLFSVFHKESLFIKMHPSGFISYLAFQAVLAIVTQTVSMRLHRPALCKTTSDLILSVSLTLDMVLAADLIDFSILIISYACLYISFL